jgi:hypothetical protein
VLVVFRNALTHLTPIIPAVLSALDNHQYKNNLIISEKKQPPF